MLKKLFLCFALFTSSLGIVNVVSAAIQRCAVIRTEDLQDGSSKQHVVVSHDQIMEWIRSKQYLRWEHFYTKAMWLQIVEQFDAAVHFFDTTSSIEHSMDDALADAIQEGIQKAAALCASEVALLQAGIGSELLKVEDIQNAAGQEKGRAYMIQQVYDKAQALQQSEHTRNYIMMNMRPSLADEGLDNPELYEHMLHILALEDLTSIVRLKFGIAVLPESQWWFAAGEVSEKSVQSCQQQNPDAYDEMVKIFENDKSEGAKIWVEHVSRTTKEEFIARMAQNGSTPADMILGWIETLQTLKLEIEKRLQVSGNFQPLEEMISLKITDHIDALTMKLTSGASFGQQVIHQVATIEEVRALIVEHFMRIEHLLKESIPLLSKGVYRQSSDGLLQLLYAVSELTLQRWAEHDLSVEQLKNLFEKQYSSIQKLIILWPYPFYCGTK